MNLPHLPRRLRLLAATAALISLAFVARAQAAATGAVAGTVSHAQTGANLEGAEVSVAGQPARVFTGRDGTFTLSDLPAGAHTLRIYYTGLEIVTQPVEVRPGATVAATVALRPGPLEMEAFTVTSAREGEAASITKQRIADNIVNVVAIDTFGDVADGNLGNFMVRLPGVAAEETSNGDIIGIRVRGTPAELNSVNMDGVRVSNAVAGFSPMGDRAAMIDQLPAEFIKEVEVHKAPIPSMPADAIGGSVNLITKSALDFREPVLTYKLGASYNTYRDTLRNFKPTATLSYMTRAGPRRNLGLTLSLSYSETEMPRDRMNLSRADADGRVGLARSLAEVNTRERAGAGLKFDYRFNESTSVAVKFNYSTYRYEGLREIAAAAAAGARRVADYSRVSRAQIEAGTPPRDSANQLAGVAPGFTDAYTELLAATWTNAMGYVDRLGRNYLGEISGQKKLPGGQKLTFQASFNPSWYDADLPTFTTTLTNGLTTAAVGLGMAIDSRQNRSRPLFTQTYGSNVAAGGSPVSLYTATYSFGKSRTEEEVANVQVDYTKDWKIARAAWQLKAGANLRSQHRENTSISSGTYRVVGADGVAMRNPATGQNDDLAFLTVSPGYGLFNHQYPRRDFFDIMAIRAAAKNQPAYFLQTAFNNQPSSNEATEDVTSGYVQGRVMAGRLTVLGGARYERTDIEASGRNTDPRRPTVTRVERESDYADLFPSLHFTYAVQPRLLARASVSTGMARPGISNLFPTTTVSYTADGTDGVVSQNDVGLKPQYSKNYDASLEYYFEPSGVFSIGVFRKDVTDFLARETSIIGPGADNGFDGLYSGFDLRTTSNQGRAKIKGIELNYLQRLTFLPVPFDRLQVFANLTDLTTRGEYAEGATELAKFTPRTSNVGFTFPWRRFEMRVAQRYTSAHLDSYNANLYQQLRFRPDEKLDLSFKYQLDRRFAVYFDVLNVFNKWADQYSGRDEGRIVFSNVYGTKFNLGVNGRF